MRLPYFKNVVWWTLLIIIALVIAGCWRVSVITKKQIAQIERDRARVERSNRWEQFEKGLKYCPWMQVEGGWLKITRR